MDGMLIDKTNGLATFITARNDAGWKDKVRSVAKFFSSVFFTVIFLPGGEYHWNYLFQPIFR